MNADLPLVPCGALLLLLSALLAFLLVMRGGPLGGGD